MTGLMGGPKVDKSAQIEAERRAREAEAKTKLDEQALAADTEYRRTRQRGKASTILTVGPQDATRTMLGG